jgi:uncharacterized membrane protein YbhN (UPF0104 family)
MIYATVLFLIGFFASVYPSKMREMLGLPVRGINKSALKFYENQLQIIEALHGNTYTLVLFLAWNAMGLATYLFWMFVLAIIISFVGYEIQGKVVSTMSFGITFLSLGIGGATGKAQRMRLVLKDLYSFDTRAVKLREQITSIKEKLGNAVQR